MILSSSKTFLLACVICNASSSVIAIAAPAPRDYLTPKEEERVKEAQILDKRIDVFIKAAERRLQVIAASAPTAGKDAQKELDKWGELPTGTRAELINDIANILDAAITNIDDVALRDDKNALIPKSLRKLANAATRFQAQLTALREQALEASERSAIQQVIINVEEILEAANKLPVEQSK